MICFFCYCIEKCVWFYFFYCFYYYYYLFYYGRFLSEILIEDQCTVSLCVLYLFV